MHSTGSRQQHIHPRQATQVAGATATARADGSDVVAAAVASADEAGVVM
jgi:hypothetical protein